MYSKLLNNLNAACLPLSKGGFLAAVLIVVITGCGGGGSDPIPAPPSTLKAITALSLNGVVGTINETGKTIAVAMPFGTDVTALVATFTTTGTSVKVGSTGQISGTTANNFTNQVIYTVTAADASTQDYTVVVTVALSSAKAITTFSLAGVVGTINETGKTIAVTMPYGTSVTALVATFTTTGASVKVGSTVQISGTTANNFTSPVTYTVTAADATTQDYTVTVTVVLSSAKAITAFSLNGVVGTINETGKTIAVAMPFRTDVTALVATFTTTGANVKVGSTIQISGTTAHNFTSPVIYTVTASDATTQDYMVFVTVALSSAKAITTFSLAGVAGTINETGKTIAVTMPFGTSVTALVASFTTTGANVKVGSTLQISGTTANNFTTPVTYTVTASDATTQDYMVFVTVALSSSKAITAFSLAGIVGTINEAGKTILVAMPFTPSVSALVATFTTTGANVKVGSTLQISGTTANNFTTPVTYTVTAADATTQDYMVTVTAVTFVTTWGSSGTGNGQFSTPRSIAVDASGNVYVADSGNNRIQKFSSAGVFITTWGSQGTGNGQFNDPRGVAVDASGNVYAVDSGNNRIQKFSSSGVFITTWGSYGTGNGQFSSPIGITVDASGNIYVTDYSNNRIQKFSSSGVFITTWGSYGTGNGQLWHPTDIVVDVSGNVYVIDQANYRIQKFSSSGAFITTWGSQGEGNGQFLEGYGVAVDASGNVYATDAYSIKKFSSSGAFITTWGSSGTGNGQFANPSGVAVDASGNVYVADTSTT